MGGSIGELGISQIRIAIPNIETLHSTMIGTLDPVGF